MFHLVFAETPFTDNIQADERPIVRVKNFKASFTPVLNNRLFKNQIRAFNFTQNVTPFITREYVQDCLSPFHLFVEATTPNEIVNASTLLNHFIVLTYLRRPNLQTLSPHSVLKPELPFKKLLVDMARVHKITSYFFIIRLS